NQLLRWLKDSQCKIMSIETGNPENDELFKEAIKERYDRNQNIEVQTNNARVVNLKTIDDIPIEKLNIMRNEGLKPKSINIIIRSDNTINWYECNSSINRYKYPTLDSLERIAQNINDNREEKTDNEKTTINLKID